MEDTDKKECSCDCSCCKDGHMAGGDHAEHKHEHNWEDKEWTKEDLMHKKEHLEKKLAWVSEKLGTME